MDETKGIIMYSKNHKEKDKLVKIFTEKYGKLVFFVRGVNKKNHPLKSSILNMTSGTYIGEFKEQGLSFLNAAKEIHPYLHLQTDIYANAYGTYLINLVDAAIEDKKYDPFLFTFLKESLNALDEKKDPEVITNLFELQILPRFGVTLHLNGCSICQNTKGPFDFSMKYDGLLCQNHFHLDERRLHGNLKATYFLYLLSQIPIDRVGEIKLSEATKKELRKLIDEIYDEYVGIHLKSKSFIDEMKKWEEMLPQRIDKTDKTP